MAGDGYFYQCHFLAHVLSDLSHLGSLNFPSLAKRQRGPGHVGNTPPPESHCPAGSAALERHWKSPVQVKIDRQWNVPLGTTSPKCKTQGDRLARHAGPAERPSCVAVTKAVDCLGASGPLSDKQQS